MDQSDIRAIQDALNHLPIQCRYHGVKTDPPSPRREACCDTGIPARRRQLAQEALDRQRR
ncbi:hypothetical protein ABZX68_06520 [Streptomyces cellulosae]